MFVNLPRWTIDTPVSVAEVVDGRLQPYPNAAWNAWRNVRPLSPRRHFVCVQSIVFDPQGHLWVVDPASPDMSGPVKGGPKLVEINVTTNAVMKIVAIPETSAPPGSYLNDVRFSPDGRYAYMSDSGLKGAIVVADVQSGQSWRVLDGDPTTQYDPKVFITILGVTLRRPDGRTQSSGIDGIAISPDGATFYYQALRGRTLYSIPTSVLRDPNAAASAAAAVHTVATTHPADGLWIDAADRFYITDPTRRAVQSGRISGPLRTLVADPRLHWPDTFTQGPGGAVYFTTSHIEDSPWFHPARRTTPSEIWRIAPVR